MHGRERSECYGKRFFPSSCSEALAMLYVNKNSSAETQPEELLRMYKNALERIREENKKISAEKKVSAPKISY